MSKFGISQTIKRVEDVRFLTGHGRYIDDIAPADALFAYVFRSSVAHGDIVALDLGDARAAPGVALILTAADLEAAGMVLGMAGATVKNIDGSTGAAPMRPILAKGRVRFVGEAVALIVAGSLEQAKDAAELIGFEYRELPVHVGLEPGGPEIHAEAPGNLAYDYALGDAVAVDAAFAVAAYTTSLSVHDNRIIANSMEPRGAYAEWVDGRLHLAVNGQGVWGMKGELVKAFGLTATDVRVTNPDVGGGFGMKGMAYPEYFALAQAARALGRPVRWMSERTEAMLTDNAGRDLVSVADLAFDANYKITAYRVNTVSNLGAYNSGYGQPIQSELFAKVLTGAYDIQTVYMNTKGIYTNTTQVDAYRGAGRPEAITLLERAVDHAARVLGLDPWEMRRRNFIANEAFPYLTATGETYDVGDFNRVLARVGQEADLAGYAGRKAASSAKGKLRGMGLCYYIESILGDPSEAAKVTFDDAGTVSLYVGTQSGGQGHETVYAQFLAARTGIPVEMIRVVQGDSDLIAKGGGTGGSRSVTTQSTATIATIDYMIGQFTPFLAEEMGVDPQAMAFEDGTFRAPGSNMAMTLVEAADLARHKGRADLLSHEQRARISARSYPNGAHVTEVEIDPETGVVQVLRYTVTDDFGVLVHPVLAEGQVHGGVVQGIGQALTEHVVHDENGQLLTATFMDYGMPRADDVPMITFTTEPVPSTGNPLGMKGCGEAGTVGALAAVSNAVLDALWDAGVKQIDMPFTPLRVWGWLQESTGAAA